MLGHRWEPLSACRLWQKDLGKVAWFRSPQKYSQSGLSSMKSWKLTQNLGPRALGK